MLQKLGKRRRVYRRDLGRLARLLDLLRLNAGWSRHRIGTLAPHDGRMGRNRPRHNDLWRLQAEHRRLGQPQEGLRRHRRHDQYRLQVRARERVGNAAASLSGLAVSFAGPVPVRGAYPVSAAARCRLPVSAAAAIWQTPRAMPHYCSEPRQPF